MRHWSVAVLGQLVVLVATAACGGDHARPDRPAVVDSGLIDSIATGRVPAMTGIWTVTGYHMPGISAMSEAGARAWRGQTVRLATDEAFSPGNACAAPGYTTKVVARDTYLASDYRLPPGALPVLGAQQEITVLEVRCDGSAWTTMGSRLIAIDADRVLAPWDGVFLELTRDQDVRAVGQEPGWLLELRKGKEIRFSYDYGQQTVTAPSPQVVADTTGSATYRARSEADDIVVMIAQSPCNDVMSGEAFEATVTIRFRDVTYRGCGRRIP